MPSENEHREMDVSSEIDLYDTEGYDDDVDTDLMSDEEKPHFVEHTSRTSVPVLVSPFDHAPVLSIDGFGDMISAMGPWRGSRLKQSSGVRRSL